MLELAAVTVSYGSGGRAVLAVDEVSAQLPAGQTLALLGPSGCGKTTLLRAIAGLEPVRSGDIRFDGASVLGVPVHRRGFGLLFQDGALFPHRTVGGNIAYGLARQGKGPTEQQLRVAELLDLVGLEGYADRGVDTLSGGQAQRVALARALAPQPRLLLLDEPMAALDAGLRGQLLTDVRAILQATATTAIYVTHDHGEAFVIADQVAVMNQGRIVQQDTPAALWQRPADRWIARFTGYTDELPAGHGIAGLPDGPIMLRPSAFAVDPAGPLRGTIVAVRPAPDGAVLGVRIGQHQVSAISDRPELTEGEVRLRVTGSGGAHLPGDEGDIESSDPA